MAALVGGGVHAKPGEISLAHRGVLFLDELPEFQPQTLDSLRQPIESGEVAIARANHRIVYPARFQLVAAMNPCRCGQADEPGYACHRAPNARCVAQYQSRLSGPLLDRFDLTIDVPSVGAADLLRPAPAEGSAEVAERVLAAREIQSAPLSFAGARGGRLQRRGAGQRRRSSRRARGRGALAAARGRRTAAPFRARLSSRAQTGAHARRSRRRRRGEPRPPRGGVELSRRAGARRRRGVIERAGRRAGASPRGGDG
jgi:Mg-chelatase subunit ChlI